MAIGHTPVTTIRLAAGPSISLNRPVTDEPPAPLMLLFLLWSMLPGHSSSKEQLLNANFCWCE